MRMRIERIFICVCLTGFICLSNTCADYNVKKRILLRSELLSTSQVKQLAEKYGFKLWNKIDRYDDNGYILIPKKTLSTSTKRDTIANIESLRYEPMVSDVTIENWEIRDPRGGSPNAPQRFSSQIAENSVINIRDPVFNKQWYLYNTGMVSSQHTMDINVLPVWNRGINGRGVTIAILDDGIDYTNADIYSNYDRYASYDYQDMDEDPSPTVGEETSHGTRCASIIAGSSNNYCGIGIAYNASIAGIRMLDSKTTDTIEADALSHKSDRIDIYSCNWGPRDDGTRFGGPGPLATKALHIGALKGRNELGSIYIWSSGNGGLEGDNCNADGYVTNLHTLAIGAISADGQVPLYAETCSSVLAVTFSGSIVKESVENLMINSDIGNKCKHDFQGTSSAGSIATGIVALMLQANPSLTWRDVHHIIVETAQIVNPGDGEWKRNGAGKWFNPKYGFGRLDALEMVQNAYEWKNVDTKQTKCKIPYNYNNNNNNHHLYQGGTLMVSLNGTNCFSKGKDKETITSSNTIKKIEHIQLIVTLSHECRGRMDLLLISPSGTMSPIMKPRPQDKSSKGLQEWIFKSVHFWGESPEGQWTLVFSDSTHVDPCQLNNQTSNVTMPTSTNKTDTLSTPPPLTNNQTNNITSSNNSSNANATLDSISIGNVTTNVSTSASTSNGTSGTSTEGKTDSSDVKNLYNIINNINDISQKILKLQSNTTTTTKTSEEDEDGAKQKNSSKSVPASTKTLNNDDDKSDGKSDYRDSSFREKLRDFDDSSNNTKFYERILLEKVRVSPNSDKNSLTNNSYIKEYTKNDNKQDGNGDDDDDANKITPLSNTSNYDVEDEEVSGTNEEKPRRSVATTPLNRFHSSDFKKEHIEQKTHKNKRSKQYTPYKTGIDELKRSKVKISKMTKPHSERKNIVGKFHSLTLIIYGT